MILHFSHYHVKIFLLWERVLADFRLFMAGSKRQGEKTCYGLDISEKHLLHMYNSNFTHVIARAEVNSRNTIW